MKKHIDPIAQFMQEHDEMLLQLSSLNKHSRHLETYGYSEESFGRILAAVEFIEQEVSVHNKSEEEALFPVLERYVEGPTRIMRQDHRQLKKAFRQLQRAVLAVSRNTGNRATIKELTEVARSIVHLFVNHIHKENHILFPLVQKFLTKDALREVARRML